MKCVSVLICIAGLCLQAAAAAPKATAGQAWLAVIPPLPTTAEAAYAQWVDVSGALKPGPTFEAARAAREGELARLARPEPQPTRPVGPASARDEKLARQISVFPGAATVQQGVRAARTAQLALEQKWRAELDAIEKRRQQERSALPACHNDVGQPSQLAIRDVEQRYAQQKIALAAHYLAQFQPLVEQMRAAIAPRIEHAGSAMAAWRQLRNAGLKARLAPIAEGSESAALQDVGSVQAYVEEISKLAARPVAQQRAIARVYSQARGC